MPKVLANFVLTLKSVNKTAVALSSSVLLGDPLDPLEELGHSGVDARVFRAGAADAPGHDADLLAAAVQARAAEEGAAAVALWGGN